ncbi:Piwi-domain-containing protein, partial [Cytidiella melzeri]
NATAINMLQMLITQAPNVKHNFALHSKSFYISRHARNLPSGLQAWTGFFQSVRPVLGKILINVDTTTAAVYKEGSLMNNAMEVLRCRNTRELVDLCNRDQQAWNKLRRFYKNVSIVAIPAKKGKIAELVKEAGKYEFLKDGQMTTVEEHFRSHHGKHLQEPRAFGVRIGKDAVYPAEVCKILPGQVYKKKLDPTDMAEFLKLAVLKPQDRMNAIGQAVHNDLMYTQSPYMSEAGMKVETQPLEINARELKAPVVKYGGNELSVRSGAWNVVNQRFQQPAKILAWAIVCFDSSNQAADAVNRMSRTLFTNLQKLGEPDCPVKDPQATFILVVLPMNAAVLRREVKQWGDIIQGIATQCVRQGKYERANDQYCNNLALKINMKCGGVNSLVRSSGVDDLIKNSMIVGCDVTHPSPGVANRPSVASLVFSVHPEATRYNAFLSVQEPRQELISDISSMMRKALQEHTSVYRKAFPKTLVVFRDGVSEGEYSQLENTEIKEIESTSRASQLRISFKQKIELIFIVVGKRHHVRFFPSDKANGDRSGNCNPGLVVDKELVNSAYMDYYLQSHAGILGTSRPSHYVVIKNTPQWSADQLQEFSYALCHIYAASTRAVSIPAPVYCMSSLSADVALLPPTLRSHRCRRA